MSLFSCEALHQPWWWKPHGRHWPLHLCPVAKMRSNCKIDINQYLCRFWTNMDMISFFIFSKVTGVVDIAPRSTVGPGLSLLSLGCDGGCSEASKEIMSDKEAMQSKKIIDVASPSLKMCGLGNDFCIPYNSQYLWWHVGGEWSYAPCLQSMFILQWFLLAK